MRGDATMAADVSTPYEQLIELSPDAILVACDGKIVFANNAAALLVGYKTPDELLGLSPLSFVREDLHRTVEERIAAAFVTGKRNPVMEQVWVRRDGSETTVSVAGARITWHGQAALTVCARDITEQQRLREEAERGRAIAEHASRSKSRLVTAVSHDLRQPLQSLSLFASVVEADPNVSAQSRIALGHLRDSVERMGQLLDSILDMAKLDVGLVQWQKRRVALGPLLAALATEMAPQAEAKGLRLKVVPSSLVIDSDPVLLTRMLRNLIANAIRYTEHGKALVGVRRRGEDCDIGVYDTGIGIEADKLKLVFEEFYQIGNPARDSRMGLGLGLPIVERLAKVLSHRIVASSIPGKGSCFSIIVSPTGTAPANPTDDSAPAS